MYFKNSGKVFQDQIISHRWTMRSATFIQNLHLTTIHKYRNSIANLLCARTGSLN